MTVSKKIVLGIGEPLYYMTVGKKEFIINWQFEHVIDHIKAGPISQRDLLLKTRLSEKSCKKLIYILEKYKILKSYKQMAANGYWTKMLLLNQKGEFKEVIIDPRPWKLK